MVSFGIAAPAGKLIYSRTDCPIFTPTVILTIIIIIHPEPE